MHVPASWLLPLMAFACLAILEHATRTAPSAYEPADHALNLAGLAIQGIAVPVAGYWIATHVLAVHWPEAAGSLPLGWAGAFALNFVLVDFLYYWQHRAFHAVPALWALHQCHHASPTLSVWATSRNSLAVNLVFVYILVNPVLGFLCDSPEGFFAAAAVTACLDLWRHSRWPARLSPRFLGLVLVTPAHHHAHHALEGRAVNFGANLVLWDRLLGTFEDARGYPSAYGARGAPGSLRQFLFPW
jgi:sterol desaturase/sphingolipid hydroxylase (fatty acid hydroxylase superfamily)